MTPKDLNAAAERKAQLKAIKDALYCHLPGYTECPDFIAEAVLQSVEGAQSREAEISKLEADKKILRDAISFYASKLHVSEPTFRKEIEPVFAGGSKEYICIVTTGFEDGSVARAALKQTGGGDGT